ncbi:hypothetical protein COY34_01550 [candidate division WWE3 bacterium CG_4_10_14_0_2_um_filter_42_8]|uniref:Glycosyltransferase RgtA/B/C/D-like domain-containing protein n=1 Tax=candidate division WWE3 bacterium CG_4_10_14_0_2_um_filter_42_8 TaxID=1975074 RepID=A0A2M7TCQ6_UNCKA|nr:MAG: hypothetical protein COY34_01550 [candidate division WWE3 bacterium CG_4_10_14_0_2_um_filter_42_8]
MKFNLQALKQKGFQRMGENLSSFPRFFLFSETSFCLVFLLSFSFCSWFLHETTYYLDIGAKFIASGQIPYRDFSLEHPPGAFFYFAVVYLFAGGWFAAVYPLLNWLSATLIFWRNQFFGLRKILGPAILVFVSPYLLFRYDLLPAVLSYFSFTRLVSGKILAAGLFLGLGIITKIYPIFFVPLFFIFVIFKNSAKTNFKKAAVFLGGIAAGLLIPAVLLFLIGGSETLTSCFKQIFVYHFSRGVQIESTWGGVFLLGHPFDFRSLLIYNFSSWNVLGFPENVLALIPPVELLALFLVYFFFALELKKSKEESFPKESLLLKYLVLAVLILLFFGKVFSPQYLLWPLFFFLELYKREEQKLSTSFYLYLLIALLTFVVICFYGHLVEGALWLLIILNLRNVLVGILIFRTTKLRFA